MIERSDGRIPDAAADCRDAISDPIQRLTVLLRPLCGREERGGEVGVRESEDRTHETGCRHHA